MLSYNVDIVGVVVAAISTMIIGFLWYGPVLGKKWMELVEMKPEMMQNAKSQANKGYAVMMLSAIVMAYVLGFVLENMFVPNLVESIITAFFVWLGFVATSMVSEYVFNAKPKPWALYILNSSYYLVALVVNAAILFLFMR